MGAPSTVRASLRVSLAMCAASSIRAAARETWAIAWGISGAESHSRGMAGVDARAAAGNFPPLAFTSASIMFVRCSFGEPSNRALEPTVAAHHS